MDDIGSNETRADAPQAVSVTVHRDGTSTLGNRPGPKGRWKYTDREIERLGQSLEAYFSDPDHLFFESWAAGEGLSLRQCRPLLDHPGFKDVWEKCETRQCSRLLELSSRAVKDDRGSTYFRINPRISTLILQTKFGYVAREELTVKAEETDQFAQIKAARKALQTAIPPSVQEARRWLTGISSWACRRLRQASGWRC